MIPRILISSVALVTLSGAAFAEDRPLDDNACQYLQRSFYDRTDARGVLIGERRCIDGKLVYFPVDPKANR